MAASSTVRATVATADAASWYCSFVIVVLILLTTASIIDSTSSSSVPSSSSDYYNDHTSSILTTEEPFRGSQFVANINRPCDEIYVVGEGETLHTISDKCGDPFIVEQNPHIQDPDDVFPGLVIKITPNSLNNRKLLSRGKSVNQEP